MKRLRGSGRRCGRGNRTPRASSTTVGSSSLRGLRWRPADPAAAADLDDHPCPILEGAGPLSGPPLPGGDLRRSRQRPLGPAAGGQALRLRGAGRAAGGAGHHRHRPGGGRLPLDGRPVGTLADGETGQNACSAACSSARRSPWRQGTRTPAAFEEPYTSTEGWAIATATTGWTTGTSSSSSSPSASPNRTLRRSRPRTASAGAWRPPPRS